MILALFALPPLSPAARRPFPDTREEIRVFYDQLPSWLTDEQWRFAATHYAGCQKALLSEARTLRSHNRDFLVLHYQLGLGQGPFHFIDGDDWVQDWDDGLADFRSYAGAGPVSGQDDWFVLWGGERVHQSGWGWYVMDITCNGSAPSTGYPEYWVASCLTKMRRTECDGVFADSFTIDGYFGQVASAHPWFNDVDACLAGWIPHLESYASCIRSAFAAQTENFYFLPNLGGLVTGWDATDYAALGDGGMNEGFGEWGPGDYYDPSDWVLQMDRLLALARAGKILLLECDPPVADYRERMFLVGCCLLIKGNQTYVTLSGAEVDCEWFPEYEIDLGGYLGEIPAAVAGLYDSSWNVYRRDYEEGLVLVNPAEATRQISDLGGSFRLVSASGGGAVPENGLPSGSLSFASVDSLTLPPHAAAILLRPIDADLNDDGVVDSRDYGILMSAFGTGSGPADLNGDGEVDGEDGELMAGRWSE
jgi:hypothetical protein